MNRNTQLAASIAAILAAAASGSALAAGPVTSLASAESPDVGLFISGSSAAKPAVLSVIEGNLCGNSYDLFSSTGDTNFFAVSCVPASGTVSGATGSAVFTIWYRDEGGSVTGALPLVSGSSINQLNLNSGTAVLASTTTTTSSYTITVTGSSASNGIDDSFTGGGLLKEPVQYGITDVEPSKLVKDNYPSAYLTGVYGTATATQLSSLSSTALFQQVFGIFVNTNTSAFGTNASGQGTATASLSLSKEAIANLLNGTSGNWQKVPTTAGAATTSSAVTVTIVNREAGSGSRTQASVYFLGDECVTGHSGVSDVSATDDYFSTGNVLSAANSVAGAITYATIDNAGSTSWPNLTLVAIDGIQPSNLNAATGQYDDWFEATGVTGTAVTLSTNQTALVSYLQGQFFKESTAPHAADILAIPTSAAKGQPPVLPVSNSANTGPSSTSTGVTIYINPFTRSKNSCTAPVNFL